MVARWVRMSARSSGGRVKSMVATGPEGRVCEGGGRKLLVRRMREKRRRNAETKRLL